MKQILDAPEKFKANSRTFSLFSLLFSTLAIIVGIYLLNLFPERIRVGEELPKIINYLSIVVFVLSTGAIVTTIIAFTNKEPNNWIKWTGGILTILLSILFIYSVLLGI